jgi:hypothetical protein
MAVMMVRSAFLTAAVRRGRSLRALVLGLAVALSACGGGVFLGFGDGFDDSPPSVTLATAASSVAPGQSVRFVAAAADENGIDRVDFYRVDAGGAVWVGADAGSPYEVSVIAPADGRSSLSVFATATDGAGNHADSAIVSVAVTH